jgi:hypothetical protein
MSKIIRVKSENAQAALDAIPGSCLTEPPPYENPIWSDDEPSLLPATGMVGLMLPKGISGNQAHKLLRH